MSKYLLLVFIVFLQFLSGCSNTSDSSSGITIIISEEEHITDHITANDLKNDLIKIGKQSVAVESWTGTLPNTEKIIVVGTVGQHALIDSLVNNQQLTLSADLPGSRGGIWAKTVFDNKTIAILAGSDVQGTQYATYDYSRDILGVDPLTYWTGIEPIINPELDVYNFEARTIEPPQVPYLVYFENDVDELANMKKPYLEYDWENYTQMIDSLVRLRYNGIEFFDMLGRVEFYTRPGYKAIRPDYEFNMPLLEKMIDYAKQKGMHIQIDMMMGRPFKSITMEESNCWREHKQKWIDTWTYYLTETPIKDADIFTLRPRNQVLDWPYRSSCEEDRVQVFNEVYAELNNVLNQYKPDSVRVCVCYDDGMELYNEGFRPPENFIIAWPDDGWGDFRLEPESTDGFKFGSYMHAGFWLNHDVHDPYPEKIQQVMTDFFERFNGDHYLMVNGQTFRLFVINLEAFSLVAQSPEDFDGQQFYRDWITRYFASSAVNSNPEVNTSPEVNNISVVDDTVMALTRLHDAQFDNVGYVQHLWEIKMSVAFLMDQPIQRPDRTPIPVSFNDIEAIIEPVRRRMTLLEDAAAAAESGRAKIQDSTHFYHDHIYLPIKLYQDLLNYNHDLHRLVQLKQQYAKTADQELLSEAKSIIATAKTHLATLHNRRQQGDLNERWAGWYAPEKRRPNNGFPNEADLQNIEDHLNNGWPTTVKP